MPDRLEECATDLDAARAETAALRREQRERSDFLLGLVHEFRNPLTAMSGAAEILKDTLADRITAKEREFLNILTVSLARMNQMLDEMLELLALEGREVEMASEPTDLYALAGEVMQEFAPRARIYGVTLNAVRGNRLARVECDPERIRRVLANLVSNAIKYNREGGEVTVTVAFKGDSASVDVADNGPGISPEDQPRLFQRFFRSADARKKGIVGTGLGLNIAKQIVEIHGGELSFVSRPGEGSTFTFTLPRRRAAPGGKDGRP